MAMLLWCPCLDSDLSQFSSQIPVTSIQTALAIHWFLPRKDVDKVGSRFCSGHLLPPKQGRAALVVLLGASMGRREGH